MTQSNTEKSFMPLTDRENWLAREVIGIAISIHKTLGLGLLESVYEKCFCYESSKRNLPYKRQQAVSIVYDDLVLDEGLRIDILVDDLIIIELQAQELFILSGKLNYLAILN